MQRTHRAAAMLFASLVAAGALARSAARAQAAHEKGEAPQAVAPTGATEEILRQANGYRSWQRFPRYVQRPVLSRGHWNTYVVAWYNDAAAPTVKGGAGVYPDGSVLVKENRREPEAEPSTITVMAKRGGAWYWVKATPDWKVVSAGGRPLAGQDVPACAGCHAAAEDDMVFSR